MKTKTTMRMFATVVAGFCFGFASGQSNFKWENDYNINGGTDCGLDIHMSSNGNLYATGFATDSNGASSCRNWVTVKYNGLGGRTWTTTWHPSTGCTATNNYGKAITNTTSSGTDVIFAVGCASGYPAIIQYNSGGVIQSGYPATYTVNCTGGEYRCIATDGNYIYAGGYVNSNNGQGKNIIISKWPLSSGTASTYVYNSSGSQDDELYDMKYARAGYNNAYSYLVACGAVNTSGNVDAISFYMNPSGTPAPYAGWPQTWNNGGNDFAFGITNDCWGDIGICGQTNDGTYNQPFMISYITNGSINCSPWIGSYTGNGAFFSIDNNRQTVQFSCIPYFICTGYTTTSGGGPDVLTATFNDCASWQTDVKYNSGGTNSDYGYMVLYGETTGRSFVGAKFGTNGNDYGFLRYYGANFTTHELAGSHNRNGTGADNLQVKYPLEIYYNTCWCQYDVAETGATLRPSNSDVDFSTMLWSDANNGTPPCCSGGSPTGGSDTSSTGGGGKMHGGYNYTNHSGVEPIAGSEIFPNPSSGRIIYRNGSKTIYNDATFIVYDVFGREVKRVNYINAIEFEIDMNNFPKGLYFYRYMHGDILRSAGSFVISQ